MNLRTLNTLLTVLAQCSILTYAREPDYYETQGRIDIKVVLPNARIYEYPSAFDETYDLPDQRARVSIGNIGYDQTTYLSISGARTITKKDGKPCEVSDRQVELVPELSWFASMFLSTDRKFGDACIGPTCMVKKFESMCSDVGYIRTEIDDKSQSLLTKSCYSEKKDERVELAIIVRKHKNEPLDLASEITSHELENLVQATVTISPKNPATVDVEHATFLIKWHDIAPFDRVTDPIEHRFLKPMGCGKHLDEVRTSIEAQSFSLLMRQHSKFNRIMIAYDHKHGLLRRESGEAVRIWDIQHETMYYIDGDNPNRYTGKVDLSLCSVLQVSAEVHPEFRPYTSCANSFDLLEFLVGVGFLHYLGEDLANGQPCHVYEFYSDVAPPIFASKDDDIEKDPVASPTTKYMGQLYIARGEAGYRVDALRPREDFFFPHEIRLYETTDTGDFRLKDVIEIEEFHWSLEGWRRKQAEMFMVPECYTSNEQLRLEAVIKLDGVHGSKSVDDQFRDVLNYNKFRFEEHMVDSLFEFFHESKTHLIEYELNFRPHHIDLSMLIGDLESIHWMQHQQTSHVDVKSCSPSKKCIGLTSSSHEECLSYASLVKSVSYVASCGSSSLMERYCLVYIGDAFPAYVNPINDDSPLCDVHSFVVRPAKRAIPSFRVASELVNNYRTVFEAKRPGKSDIIRMAGQIESCDVSQESFEFSLSGYKFQTPEHNSDWLTDGVVSINDVETIGDCRRMCNLDADCRSFSFCPKMVDRDPSCVISTLDFESASAGNSTEHRNENGKSQLVVTYLSRTYKLMGDYCSVYNRDYLSMFAPKEHTMRIPKIEGSTFMRVKSVNECAKQAIVSESKGNKTELGSVFAYCAQTDSCIIKSVDDLDESRSQSDESKNDQVSIDQEMLCTVYRRQYHTLFHVSTPVVVAPSFGDQDSLHLLTAEECAHACWNDFGDACHSFDFCDGDNGCKINKISTSDASLAPKSGCLHYERDLKLDHVRREYLIGRHQLLVTGGFSFRQLIVFSFLLVPMAIGLLIGSRTDGRLAIPSGSILSGLRLPNLMSSPLFGSSSSPPSRILSGEEKNYDDGTDGIQMSYINESYGADKDALAKDF